MIAIYGWKSSAGYQHKKMELRSLPQGVNIELRPLVAQHGACGQMVQHQLLVLQD